jgi:hypothetical protein
MRLTLLILLLIDFSCSSRKQVDSPQNNFVSYPQIPDSLNLRKQFVQDNDKIFNLPSLLNGTKDSLEIRILPFGAFDFQKQVFIFKIDTTGWHGYHYFSYTLPVIDQEGKTMLFSDIKKIGDSVFLVKEIIPACGWEKFSDSMNFFSIRTLPTQSLIENFKYYPVRDGGGVNIEIATNESYRFISYDNPEMYSYNECKEITGFIKMLERQLGKDYTWPTQLLTNKRIIYRN